MEEKFICLLGIDGSGKSTLALNLVEELNRENGNFRYVWGGCRHYLSYPLVIIGKKIFLHGENQYENYCEYQKKIKKTVNNSVISKFYQHLLKLDYYLQIFFKIQIPLLLGEGIIVDRYIYGTFIDMAVNLGHNEQELKENITIFLKICPKPDIVFFIDLPEEIAFSRKNDIPSLDYLKLRIKLYHSIVEDFGIIRLNGLNNPDELKKYSLNKIRNGETND